MVGAAAAQEMAYLVGGGYEGQIIGYQLSGELLKPAEDGAPRKAPAPIFAFSAHTGLIRTVACSAGLLATALGGGYAGHTVHRRPTDPVNAADA